MKKAVKIMAWILGGVLALVVLAVLALPLWIGPTVKGVAEGVAPKFTGTPFKMEKFSLNPYTGKLFISGFNLGNPEGFDEKSAVSFSSLSVDVEVASLFTKKIHVRDITLESPFVSYVFDKNGTNNFDRIRGHVQSKLGPAKEEKEAKNKEKIEAKSEKKVQIDRLCINGTKVKYRMLTLPIPLPTLTNIGKDKAEGASFDEVGQTIWEKAKGSITGFGGALGGAAGSLGEGASSLLKGAGNILNDGTAGAAGKAGDAAKAATEKATETAKAATEKTTEAVKDAGKAVGDAVGKAAEGAKDALKNINPFGK